MKLGIDNAGFRLNALINEIPASIAKKAVEDFIKAYRDFSTEDKECPFECGVEKLCINCFGEYYLKEHFNDRE